MRDIPNGRLPSIPIPPTAGSTDHAAGLSFGRGGRESVHPVVDAFRSGCGVDRLQGAGTRYRGSLRVREQASHHSLDFILVRWSGGVEPDRAAGGGVVRWAAGGVWGGRAAGKTGKRPKREKGGVGGRPPSPPPPPPPAAPSGST